MTIAGKSDKTDEVKMKEEELMVRVTRQSNVELIQSETEKKLFHFNYRDLLIFTLDLDTSIAGEEE